MFGDIIFLSIATFKIWVGILMQKVLHYNTIAGYIELITVSSDWFHISVAPSKHQNTIRFFMFPGDIEND